MSYPLAKGWAALIGIVLVAVGLLGFVNNPIVGSSTAIFPTGNLHNVVHVLTGLIALYVAFGLRGESQAIGLIGFGILYGVVFVALLVSDNLFGVFDTKVNVADHVLHAAVALVSIAIGYMGRSSASTTA